MRRRLPTTKANDMKKPKWTLLYAYNLRTVRDVFVYCSIRGKIAEEELYKAMKDRIPPPKAKWLRPGKKRKERLRLEYIHTARYLGLIKKEGSTILPDFSDFVKEKRIIIGENQNRSFQSSKSKSPSFTPKEMESLLSIVLGYERARDFLLWFLDFQRQFPNINSFDVHDFKEYAKPIFVLGKIQKGKKGREFLKREIDKKIWRIPDERGSDYTRLASYIFPSWFKELGLIDEVIVFPEFSDDRKLWHMYYPIKTSEEDFLKVDLPEFLGSLCSQSKNNRIWTPWLIFMIAKKYGCPAKAIDVGIENAYRAHPGRFYFSRAPIHLMRHIYKDSYIKINGFFRSYMSVMK